jgi:hemolysin III
LIPREERFNVVSHLLGAILAVPATFLLVREPWLGGDVMRTACFLIYGLTLFLAFLTSTLFHATEGSQRAFFRRYDRVAIYLLIGGCYTPIMLLRLPEPWGWIMLPITWVMVIIAIMIEHRPHLLKHPGSLEIYVLMGWMCLPILLPLTRTITLAGVGLLLLGGLFYTLGAATVRWGLLPRSHEVWHVAVLAAAACHYVMMYVYVS